MKIHTVHREALLTILTVVVLAFFVSSLANIGFTLWFDHQSALYLIVTLTGISFASTAAYVLLTARPPMSRLTVKFPLCLGIDVFDLVEVPYCQAGSKLRRLLHELPFQEQRALFTGISAPRDMLLGPLGAFLEQAIQGLVLAAVVGRPSLDFPPEANRSDALPPEFKANDNVWLALRHSDLKTFVPPKTTISIWGRHRNYFRLRSPYGVVLLEWELGWAPRNGILGPYRHLIATKGRTEDLSVRVTLTSAVRLSRVFDSGLANFALFVADAETSIGELDWSRARERLTHDLLSSVLEDLSQIKEGLRAGA